MTACYFSIPTISGHFYMADKRILCNNVDWSVKFSDVFITMLFKTSFTKDFLGAMKQKFVFTRDYVKLDIWQRFNARDVWQFVCRLNQDINDSVDVKYCKL